MVTREILEARQKSFLSELETWPGPRLVYQPSPEEWSALQVLEHLVKTEEQILVAARQGTRDPHSIGLKDRAAFLFIMKVFQSERRVSTPASAKQVLPGLEPPPFDQLAERWRETQTDFESFRAQLSPKEAKVGIFRHPVVGWMGVQQIMDFFWVHIVHHEFQLQRIREKAPV